MEDISDNHKVSILIPVFNAESYLAKTLESVFQQTYRNIEIIIVDDGSSDSSLEIARNYENANCKVITQKNKGGGAARNRALQESSGYYIQYLDADDLLSPYKIEKQIRIFDEVGGGGIVSCSWQPFTDDGALPGEPFVREEVDKDYDHPIEWLLDSWKGKGMTANSCWLTPRSIITKAGPWDERLHMNQDGEFFCRVLLNATSIKHVPNVGVYYRKGNENSITGGMSKRKYESQLLSYRLYKEHILPAEDSVRVRNALMCNYLSFMYHHYDSCKELVEEAKLEVVKLGFEKPGVWGGGKFKALSKVIGFYNALRLRSAMRKFTGF